MNYPTKNKSQEPTKKSTKNKKIILIDDDPVIIDIYETVMKKNKFNLQVIKLGKEALNVIKDLGSGDKVKPDIILLDLVLPDINGVEILRAIRENTVTKDIIVFILTNQENALLKKFGHYNPDKVIIKANTNPTKLIKIIKEQLK